MSPVITKDWGFSWSGKCQRIVVSKVLAKQFSNSRARSLSTILLVMSVITFSTCSDRKVRHSSTGRWNGSPNGPTHYYLQHDEVPSE